MEIPNPIPIPITNPWAIAAIALAKILIIAQIILRAFY